MSPVEVVITGVGVVSPIGIGREAFWNSLRQGRSGVRRLESFDASSLATGVVGDVSDFDPKQFVRPRKSLKVMSRDGQFAVTASDLASTDANLVEDAVDPDRLGVVFGADRIRNDLDEVADTYRACYVDGEFDLRKWGTDGLAGTFPLLMLKNLPNMLASHVSILRDARGPNNTLHLAGVSSLLSIAEAVSCIQRGVADVMFAGAAASRLHPIDWARAQMTRQLSLRDAPPETLSRPFDLERDGEVRGEGAGAFVLESRPFAEARGAKILARVVAWGSSYEKRLNGRAPDGSGRSIEDYLIDKAHAAGTSALLMLGGDGFDGRGFMLSTTDDRRTEFVENIVDYLVEHDYDGVDLDWENCLSGEAGCGEEEGEEPVPAAEARRRLMALIADLRAEMATRGRYADAPGLITFPGYAVKINELQEGDKVEQWQADVANAVDQYNLMSYGIGTTYNGGGWLSWFSGALFGAGGQNPVDISSSVDAYVRTGVPRDRIGIGIGFYGVYFGPSITGPRQPTDGNDIYEIQDAALAYSELDRMGYLSHGEQRWDEEAQSTYRVYGDGGFVPEPEGGLPARNPAGVLSYEDERSIAAKGDWVRETGVGGTIIWTLNYGWLPRTGTNPLLDAVKSSFLGDLRVD